MQTISPPDASALNTEDHGTRMHRGTIAVLERPARGAGETAATDPCRDRDALR